VILSIREVGLTVVDSDVIQTRWTEASGRELPKLNHEIVLEQGNYLAVDIANFKTVLATLPLKVCLSFPGIIDGKLFRPNVRQSLGLTNKVNKGMKQTLSGDSPEHFFFYHNGITALCEQLSFDETTWKLTLRGLGVVNGCQSPTTILACSERVKAHPEARVLVRFYEIPQRDLADKISIYTNSQSAVKPRDLRSNDKRILALKKGYENSFPTGYFITKRGEERPADRDETQTIDVSQLAKLLTVASVPPPASVPVPASSEPNETTAVAPVAREPGAPSPALVPPLLTVASVPPPASALSEPKEIHRVIVGPDGWGETDTSSPPALADAPGDAAPLPSSRSHMQARSGTAVEVSSGGAYAVQVASQRSAAKAHASFRALRAKFPNQLSGREPIVRRTDLGAKGIYYRAMVGPFASMEKAAGMCRTLKTAGCNCLVQRN
jgi:AIPR protein/SPOR domain